MRERKEESEHEQESELFDSWDQGRETDSACKQPLTTSDSHLIAIHKTSL